jgi:hypothetical protein
MDLKEIMYDDVDWLQLTQDAGQLLGTVDTVLHSQIA